MGHGASKSKHKSSPILSNSNKAERERRHHFNNLVNQHQTNTNDYYKKQKERHLRKEEGYNWNRPYNLGSQNDFSTSSTETRTQNSRNSATLNRRSSHQVAGGSSRVTTETMRRRSRNSNEMSPHANKGKRTSRRSSVNNNTERSSYEHLLSNWNDPQSDKYFINGTLSRVGPPASSISRMTKSQHHFQRQSTLPTKSHRKYKWDVPSDCTIIHPARSLVGPRVLPVEIPDAKEHFRMNSLRRNVNRASASYGNFDSFYPTRSYYGAEDGTRVESQIDSFLPSREDFPDSFSEFKSKQPTYSNTIHRSQFSFENKSRETAIADNFKEDNRETIFYEKKTRHPQKPSRQYGDIFNDNSASDYSENERENKAPDESMTSSQAFSKVDNQNFYSNIYNEIKVKTFDRNKKKRTKYNTSRSKPVGSDTEESPVLVSSLGPRNAQWKNSPELLASQDDFPAPPSPLQHKVIEYDFPQYHNAGTTRRKSKHRSSKLSITTGNESFDDVFEQNTEQSGRGLEHARDFTYQPSFTLESSHRRSKRKKAKETRSATDFSDLYKTLPSKFDSLFDSSVVDEQSTQKRAKKKKKRSSSIRQDSANHTAEELEKIIETQLAGALSSIITHR